MNAIVNGRIFKRGDGFAVELPAAVALALGSEVHIEQRGDEVVIRSTNRPGSDWRNVSPEQALANNRALADDLRAIWADCDRPRPVPDARDGEIFPDRPGLY